MLRVFWQFEVSQSGFRRIERCQSIFEEKIGSELTCMFVICEVVKSVLAQLFIHHKFQCYA